MNLFFNHPIIGYSLGIVVVGFINLCTMAMWCEGKGPEAQDYGYPLAIAGGIFWPIGLPVCLAYWFWQMIMTLNNFYDYAFPEPSAPKEGCNHPRVAGARFCPRCGRMATKKEFSTRSVVHGE